MVVGMAQLGFLDLCDQARASIARRDYAAARQYFEQASKIKPDSVDARYGLATVCYLMKDHKAAERYFEDVLKLDPLNAGAAINLGALCNLREDYETAITHLRKGIQLDRKRSEGYYNLGIAYRKIGKNVLAIQAYREAQHLNPRMVEAVYNLANIYVDMEQYDNAISFYKQALEINPGFRKAQEGLQRVEQRVQESSTKLDQEPNYSESEADNFAPDDERLDRILDPEMDSDLLARFYAETEEAKKNVDFWLHNAQQLDAATRGLAICLTSDSPAGDYDDSLRKFRSVVEQIRQNATRFSASHNSILKLREKMVEKG